MAVKVLVVDDSGFFRRRVCEILKPLTDIEVVGTASNGREALEMVPKLHPDVITMDYEMPVMDGITAVKELMKTQPTPVLMFSSLTYEGARVTFDALEAGAVDFLPKSFEAMSGDAGRIKQLLHDKIIQVARSQPAGASRPVSSPPPAAPSTASPAPAQSPASPALRKGPKPQGRTTPGTRAPVTPPSSVAAKAKPAQPAHPASSVETGATGRRDYAMVLIGTSTGGPVALQKILTQIPANFPKPIVLVQHMPATFTPAFAERLNRLCQLTVKQVENGEVLRPGHAYVAPGGKQTVIEKASGQPRVRVLEGDERLHYKPCVDVTFGSASKSFHGKLLGIILTGMGADGREGCRMLKQSGSVVWSQDEASSVIYGMPMAVARAGLSDEVISLAKFPERLISGVA